MTRERLVGTQCELNAPKLDESQFDLTSLRGKVVLIDFWARLCGPCMEAMPDLKKVYDERRDKGFEVVAISLDSDRESLTEFLKQAEFGWTQLYETDEDKFNQIRERFGITGIPTTYLIDKQGVVAAVNLHGYEQISKAVDELLSKP